MQEFHLAQINIGRVIAAIDDPVMRGFTDNLDRINALAERSPGFIWRLQTEDGDATSLRVFDDPNVIVNLSVWQNPQSLKQFVYQSLHVDFVRQRKNWFIPMDTPYFAMWWVPAGHIPGLEDAKTRLAHLAENGESPYAFTFRAVQPAPVTAA